MTIGKGKEKVDIQWGNYFKATPEKVKKLLLSFKALVGGVAGMSAFQDNWKVVAGSLIVGWIVQEISDFIA